MAREGQHWDEELGRYVDDDIWDPVIRIKTGAKRIKQIEKKEQSTGGYKILKEKESSKRSKIARIILADNSSSSSKKNTEVVVRITGTNSSSDGLKNHLHYISRNGEREIQSSDGEIFENYQQIKDAASSFGVNEEILSEAQLAALGKKPKREVVHIIMSMQGKDAGLEKIRQAAHETIKENFPGQYFVSATHDDTDNNHVHICMRARDEIRNKAINIDKDKLEKMRKDFARHLNERGIEATATSYEKKKKKEIDSERNQNLHFQVLNFGEANYNFDKNQQMSYYVTYRTRAGKEVTIWGEDLQRVVEENKIHVDDYCRFEVVGSQPTNKKVRIQDKKDPNIEYERTIYKKTWDVSIKGRAEKIIQAADRNELKKQEDKLTVIYKNGSAEKYKKKKIQTKIQSTQEQIQPQAQENTKVRSGIKTSIEKDKEHNS